MDFTIDTSADGDTSEDVARLTAQSSDVTCVAPSGAVTVNILDSPTPTPATLTLSPPTLKVRLGYDAQLTLELDRAPPVQRTGFNELIQPVRG